MIRHSAARVLKRLAKVLEGSEGPLAQPAPLPLSVPEITPSEFRPSEHSSPRLNLLLPSLNPEHYFGGIHTAFQFYRALAPRFTSSRIVLTDSPPRLEGLSRAPDHVLVDSQIESDASRQIVPFSDRYQRPLSVGRGDVFLATAWWTAYAAQSLLRRQVETFGVPDRMAYLIQDFEPGFYAWSSRHALALSTYRPAKDLAVFNTSILARYFEKQGLGYARSLRLEPVLNESLRPALQSAGLGAVARKRRIIVYARPSTPRNAFELICEAITLWSVTCPYASTWEVVAPGELSTDVTLGAATLRGMGKLSISEYAELLSTSAVGLSLMISPHPSYPPLEMAAFGLRVVTNGFANKDLRVLGDNVQSLVDLSPAAVARALSIACAEAEGTSLLPSGVSSSVLPGFLSASEGEVMGSLAIEAAQFFGHC